MVDIKVQAVGDPHAGKTCLFISYVCGKYPGDYVPTVFDEYTHPIMHDGKPVCLRLGDLHHTVSCSTSSLL